MGDTVIDERKLSAKERHALEDELAHVIRSQERAELLLHRAGFQPGRIAWSNNPLTFWHKALEEARNGALPHGELAIVRQAIKLYPYNEAFLRLAAQLGLSGLEFPEKFTTERERLRYCEKLRSLHGTVRIAGLDTTFRVPLRLSELHVDAHVVIDGLCRGRDVCSSEHHAHILRTRGDATLYEHVPFGKALRNARSKGTRGVVVLGDPGAGKTTQLEHVLLDHIDPSDSPDPDRTESPADLIPVYLPLRDLRAPIPTLPDLIQRELESPIRDMPDDFGRRLCQRGCLLFLLDGLDEVAAEHRAAVARWIEQAHRHAPDCYFVVTCRYAGYTREVELAHDFLELHLQPFHDDAVQAFVYKWHRIVQRSVASDPARAEQEAELRAATLLMTLSRSEPVAEARLGELKQNPAFLTAICQVNDDPEPMRSSTAFYERVTEMLIHRWHARAPAILPQEDVVHVLRSIAGWLHEQPRRIRASREELRQPVELALSRLSAVTMEADELLSVLCDESGVFRTWAPGQHGFASLGLQEHFAAQHLRAQCPAPEHVLQRFLDGFENDWSREVLRLAACSAIPSVLTALQQPASNEHVLELLISTLDLLRAERPWQLYVFEPMLSEHPSHALRRWWRELSEAEEPDARTIEPRPGGVELTMVLVPAGRFAMGSAEGEGDHDERPRHDVTLDAFYIARTPVTNAHYSAYLAANPDARPPKLWDDPRFNQPNQPVVGISWDDAEAYCAWAGLGLPTEAQWERACRSGASTAYCSGGTEADLDRVGWYFGNSNGELKPVAAKGASSLGIHDMHGNVWEWCMDAYGSYDASPRDRDGLRHEPSGNAKRVRRGGGFRSVDDCARAAVRAHWRPSERHDDLGFRPVKMAHPATRRRRQSGVS